MAFRKPRKSWGELSPAYKKRMQGKGLTSRNWSTAKGAELRKVARGHATTPERPSQAERNPDKYPAYVSRKSSLAQRVIDHKHLLFSGVNRYKGAKSYAAYNAERSAKAALVNPETEESPRTDYVKQFLKMTYDDIVQIDWSDDDWAFLFYH